LGVGPHTGPVQGYFVADARGAELGADTSLSVHGADGVDGLAVIICSVATAGCARADWGRMGDAAGGRVVSIESRTLGELRRDIANCRGGRCTAREIIALDGHSFVA
tara:strand:+ start:1112 stop:1432 length:321 start_codon:yes stop_codon:yes gene_type:complete